ncbi:MAG: hypothetical protein LBO72_10605 [Helicobacteraceae bacterium]|jgi:hypothetical protein|nr:hypothetical protein [Helicobacteraceae bacterium]
MIDLKFHHIGTATQNIEREFIAFEALGYKKLSEPFVDHKQNIRGMFIGDKRGGGRRADLPY